MVKHRRLILFAVMLAIIASVSTAFGIGELRFPENCSTVRTVTTRELKEVLEISNLSSVENTFNAIVTVKDGKKLAYHVAYEGRVTAGIDFGEVTISARGSTVTVHLPQVRILDVTVDMGSLSFIFNKARYETETVSAEAYKLCIADLRARAQQDERLLTLAAENARSTVEALISPLLAQFAPDHTLVID